MDIVEYVGLTRQAVALIEEFRSSPSETKSDIITRLLSPPTSGELQVPVENGRFLELGQGARLKIGETIFLYLSEGSKRRRHPEGTAEARHDGIYMNGKRVKPSKGSYLQAAMYAVQEKRNHRNDKGQIIALSAWRQWHVERDGKLIPLVKLKDQALAHRRRTTNAVSVAPLRAPTPSFDRELATRAAEELRALSKGVTLGGLTIKDLINEGRR